jgi:hypothetical protein
MLEALQVKNILKLPTKRVRLKPKALTEEKFTIVTILS